MGKPYIVVGDKTSHGGTVVEGSTMSTIQGKPMALVGHRVTCPIPGHGTNPIIIGDPDFTIDGQAAARHGDTTACGAMLIATQALAFDEDGSASSSVSSTAGNNTAINNVNPVLTPVAFTSNVSQQASSAGQGNAQPAATSAPATVHHGTPSGASWVNQYPTSMSTSDLSTGFKPGVESFIAALTAAGANVSISATLRPSERAYLMHWSWEIVHGTAPAAVPARNGVDIDWCHYNAANQPDPTAAQAGAQAMVNGYQIQNLGVAPALNSRHVEGNAIDMTISWNGVLTINNASKQAVVISSNPKSGMNPDLGTVGATYGVNKFVGGDADKPHWSTDGH